MSSYNVLNFIKIEVGVKEEMHFMYNTRNFWDTLNSIIFFFFCYKETMAAEKTTSLEFGTIATFFVFLEPL